MDSRPAYLDLPQTQAPIGARQKRRLHKRANSVLCYGLLAACFIFPFIFAPLAVVRGRNALAEVRLAPERLSGKSRIVAGIVLGSCSLAVMAIVAVSGIVLLVTGNE